MIDSLFIYSLGVMYTNSMDGFANSKALVLKHQAKGPVTP